MSFSKTQLKTAILNAITAAGGVTDGGQVTTARDAWADAIATAVTQEIVDAINSTTVAFTLTAPNGPVTGTITLTSPTP